MKSLSIVLLLGTAVSVSASNSGEASIASVSNVQSSANLTKNEVIQQLIHGIQDEKIINEAIAKLDPSKYTKDFTQTCNALITSDMNRLERSDVIEAVTNVIEAIATLDSANYEEFIQTYNSLITSDMDGLERSYVIKAIATLDPTKYAKFIQICNALFTPDIDGSNRAYLIEAIAKLKPEKYDDFKQTCEDLFPRKGSGYRKYVIEVIAKLDPSKYTKGFTQTCKDLFLSYVSIAMLTYVIEAVAKLDPTKYTKDFTKTCNALTTSGISVAMLTYVIEAVAKLDPAKYAEFIKTCTTVIPGMGDEGHREATALIPDMRDERRREAIAAIVQLSEPLWKLLRQYPKFFGYVPPKAFNRQIARSPQPLTEASLRPILEGLDQQYKPSQAMNSVIPQRKENSGVYG